MFGVMMELTFVAFRDLLRDKNSICLRGDISIWMFWVYAIGLTYGFDLIEYLIPLEIIIAYPLSRFNIRLWDYNYLPDICHWKGVISFAHYPVWVLFGFMVELIKLSI